jgi:malic enzyme
MQTTAAAPPTTPTTTIEQLRALPSDLDRYIALRDLQANDAAAFFSLCFQHTEEALPWLYTPTVGEACQVRQ